MSALPIDRLEAKQLAKFLSLDFPPHWSATDSEGALRHQLAARLLPDLVVCSTVDRAGLEEALGGRGATMTFEEVLSSEVPNLDVLLAIKFFAKEVGQEPANPLIGAPATVLYFAAIAAALCQGRRISELGDESLRDGFGWAQRQPGAETLRPLFTRALHHVGGPIT